MNSYTIHIKLYDLVFLGAIFTGLTFTLLLWFTKNINQRANRFLGLALAVIVLWMIKVLGIDIGLGAYFPRWNWLPLQFSLALGPLIYFYVLKITRPEYKFGFKDALHFSPLLLELGAQVLEVKESFITGKSVYDTLSFQQFNPVIQLLAFSSVIIYLYRCHRLIERFYHQLKFNSLSDRYRHQLRWLQRLLMGFGLFWLLWIPYAVVDYFYYHQQSGIAVYYPLYVLLVVIFIRMATVAFLRPSPSMPVNTPPVSIPPPRAELKQKGIWLKEAMKTNHYYQDPELSLSTLAELLGIHTHELSRIINMGLKKNFNDFINEYRVAAVTRKMQEPVYDHITLLGMAYDSGFNSKSTFNRIFKQMTGKSPVEYKTDLKKEFPTYNLGRYPQFAKVISLQEPTSKWTYDKLTCNYMFKNYLKIAWRNLIHNKVYSALNITGLASGMAVALVIGLWIYSQYSYNLFLPNYDRLYQVMLTFSNNGDLQTQKGVSLPIVDELHKNYPEVKYASETDWGYPHSLVVADKKLNPAGFMVGADFLKLFPYPLLQGNVNTVFKDPNSIVLTQSVAKALFGNQDPINKIIKVDNKNNVKVTGVMADVPANSTLKFSYLLPYSLVEQTDEGARKSRVNWMNYSYPAFVELQPGTDVEAFENKIRNITAKHDATHKIEVVLQPAKNWQLLTVFKNGKPADGFIQYVHMFGIIGILVLVIACINFVNLSTARAEKRAREVGVRKSIGSSRRELIIQFLSESLLLTFVAFAISLVMVLLALPYFNRVTFSNITLPYTNPLFWCIMIGYVLFTGLLAGSRPAFYLSSFNPVKVLKGTIQLGKRAALPRKVLVVLQFSCSITLIISTLIIYQQIKYAEDRPKGYNPEHLMMTDVSPDLYKNYTALRNDLLQSGQVVSVTKSGSSMSYFPASFYVLNWPGKKEGESYSMNISSISQDYFKTVGMKLKIGRDFIDQTAPDTLNVILNESAVEKLHLKEPLNQLITSEYTKNPMRVIGVVKNAVIGSPFYFSNPALYVYNPGWAGSILYRLKPNVNTQQAVKKISDIFNKYNPSFPFDYRFADEAFSATFNQEMLVGTLSSIFAGLAIFISCLGLFGLAAYVAEQRKKEIGIRKVLGASVSQLWLLLSSDFLVLVILSCLIASPIAFCFLQGWLQKFEYRISIGASAFVISAVVAIVITILTISYQAISSALTNPAKSLKVE